MPDIEPLDRMTPEQCSWTMSRVRSSDTLPERMLRSCLHKKGWRFRKKVRTQRGYPDIVFVSLRLAVFVDGDFWHGYQYDRWRSKLADYWKAKIDRNRDHDRRTSAWLRQKGWAVIRVREHQVLADVDRVADRVERHLLARQPR